MATDDAEYIGVSELARAVGDALSEIAEVDRRMKSGATEIPTERTIRFYLEKGLLPKPSKRLGQTLVFGRVHLLHLLVIKKLQADGVPLSAIPDILKKKGKTEAHLEELLKDDVAVFGSQADPLDVQQRPDHIDDPIPLTSFAQSIRPRKVINAESSEPIPEKEPFASEARSYLKSLLSRSPKPTLPKSTQRVAERAENDILFSRMPPPEPARWIRHELVDGLEINISDDYEAPTDEQEKAKLIEMLRKILGL